MAGTHVSILAMSGCYFPLLCHFGKVIPAERADEIVWGFKPGRNQVAHRYPPWVGGWVEWGCFRLQPQLTAPGRRQLGESTPCGSH